MERFRQEITELIPQLRRYAIALVNHNESADDLVQDCLERALANFKKWDDRRPMKPWLLTILHNIYANNARKFNRTPVLIPIHEHTDIQDKHTDNDNFLKDLHFSLNQLPQQHREIILLVGLEQMSYKETAAILNIPVGTVMSRLTRARQNLRQIMNRSSVVEEVL